MRTSAFRVIRSRHDRTGDNTLRSKKKISKRKLYKNCLRFREKLNWIRLPATIPIWQNLNEINLGMPLTSLKLGWLKSKIRSVWIILIWITHAIFTKRKVMSYGIISNYYYLALSPVVARVMFGLLKCKKTFMYKMRT